MASFDINNINTKSFPHAVTGFQIIETHISWVILTGEFAYKIKKPVRYAFIDYSTAAKREHYCHLELELNKPLAPHIYLEVVTIRLNAGLTQIDSQQGEILEHALKMRQFEQEQLFDRLCKNGQLNSLMIRDVAQQLANMHLKAQHSDPASDFGTPAVVLQPAAENFIQARPFLRDAEDLDQLQRIEQAINTKFEQIKTTIQERKQAGWVRACHGDAHLGNTALINNKPTIFDCVEFNEYFRWIDVMSEIAFMFMDLLDHDRLALAYIFLNEYLAITGDYSGLKVLNFYVSYRAMVRAKIQLFALDNPDCDEKTQREQMARYRKYARLAEKSLRPQKPQLFVMHGVSGSGKSTLATMIAEELCAIIIRSDIERKRLATNQAAGLYDDATSDLTYAQLTNIAKTTLQNGFNVVLDATYLRKKYRSAVLEMAQSLGVPVTFISCQANADHLKAALEARTQQTLKHQQHNISDATPEVIDWQLKTAEQLSPAELQATLVINAELQLSEDEFLIILKNFMQQREARK